MARRKRRAVASRTTTRTVVKRVRGRKGKSTSASIGKTVAGGFVYGMARGSVARMLTPITSKIPAGQYADEVGMGILNYFIAKGKIPFIPKHLGMTGLAIESAVVGGQLGANLVGNMSAGGSSTNSNQVFN